MRESLMYGSVRGTRGNSRPYRDAARCCTCSGRLMALRSYCENDAQRPLLEVKADSHVAVR